MIFLFMLLSQFTDANEPFNVDEKSFRYRSYVDAKKSFASEQVSVANFG